MATVYLARDTRLGRRVALKLLDGSDDPELDQRFLVEARATARCVHENIVVIHEVDQHQGNPFMVLEYLSGSPLSDMLYRRPLPASRAVELIVPVVRALACAQAQNIVHRDLKPENIILTDSGVIKVVDFGIAKLLADKDMSARDTGAWQPLIVAADDSESLTADEEAASLTEKGALMGTLPYMSPEQWGHGEVDHRSDLWAIGILLHVMVTGKHPLWPVTLRRLRTTADLSQPMPSVREQDVDIPNDLADVIDRCLCKHKHERFASADDLLDALQPLLPYSRKLGADKSPYAGLASFEEGDSERFFGRSRDIAALVARLGDHPLLGVVGPSGAGKSSFVNAGVVPALKSSGERWESLVIRPGRQPLTALASAVWPWITQRSLSSSDEESEQRKLVDRLRDEPGYLGTLLRDRARTRKRKILLSVDQFEEVYTLNAERDERLAFNACLLGMADDATTPLRVVLSIRSDFLDRVSEDRAFMNELTQGLCFLPQPDRVGLREALVQPAEMAGYSFESDHMVSQMLDALEFAPGALPLLQFTASILWDSRDRERRLLTRHSYERIGGMAGALASHADTVLASLPTPLQQLAGAVFRRLVTPERTRDIVSIGELHQLADPDEIERVVDYFVDARLLVVHQGGETEVRQVEIVHESLIASWPTLRRWLDENQEASAFLAELRVATKQWRAHDRSSGMLWRGDAENEARRWYEHCRDELSDSESAYLDAVFDLADRSARAKRRVIIGTITLLSGLVAVAIVALVLIRDAEQKASKEAQRAVAAEQIAETQRQELQKQADSMREQLDELERKREFSQEAQENAAQAKKSNEMTKEELIGSLTKAQIAKRDAETDRDVARQAEAEVRDALKNEQLAHDAADRIKEKLTVEVRELRSTNAKLQRRLREQQKQR